MVIEFGAMQIERFHHASNGTLHTVNLCGPLEKEAQMKDAFANIIANNRQLNGFRIDSEPTRCIIVNESVGSLRSQLSIDSFFFLKVALPIALRKPMFIGKIKLTIKQLIEKQLRIRSFKMT
jgi:hypothetical protein